MIRIETTAVFDADGRFSGRLTEPVPPGVHPIDVMIEDQSPAGEQTAQPVSHPQLEWEGNVLVWTGPIRSDMAHASREILDERERRMLEGPWE